MNFQLGQVADFSKAYTSAEQVKGMRQKNALARRTSEQEKELERKRKKYYEYKNFTDNIGQAIEQAKADGNYEVAEQLAKTGRETFGQALEMWESVGSIVTDQDSYDTIREQAIDSGIPSELLPVEYNPKFFARMAGDAKKKLGNIQAITMPGADGTETKRLYQDGRLVEESAPYTPKKSGGPGTAADRSLEGIPTNAANSVSRSVGRYWNAEFLPNGTYRFKDKTVAQKALAHEARAQEMYQRMRVLGDPITPAQAAELTKDAPDAPAAPTAAQPQGDPYLDAIQQNIDLLSGQGVD